ncbi:MAG TPA: MarR family transcriptional regulator [Planctomycetota bacterium]|nr:MarR family transcriptional regulator [Planctomycetota bacterium]
MPSRPRRRFPLDYRALAEFRRLIRGFLAFSERAARRVGLRPQQHQMLLAIKGLPPGVEPTVGALAAQLQIRHHSAVELLNRLVRRGLARRRRSRRDRRRVLGEVTAAGERLLRRLSLRHREELRQMGPRLLKALEAVLEGAVPRNERMKAHARHSVRSSSDPRGIGI